jgi:ribosomal protein S18 acetylase RimI-like enzyme
MPLDFAIAPTRAEDTVAVIAIASRLKLYSEERMTALADWLDDSLTRGEASMYRFLTCREAGQIIGYSCFGPRWLTDSVFDVVDLGISPDQQRQGAGAALLRHTEQAICRLAGNLALVELSGAAQFQPAHRFLEKHGYRLAADIADFYAEGESQRTYIKKLQPAAYGVEVDGEAARRMRRLQKQALGYPGEE